MTRSNLKAADILSRASDIIGGDRQDTYGPPERNFQTIARMWSAYLGHTVTARQVAWCMVLLKAARDASGHGTDDNAVDAAGYAALAGEMPRPRSVSIDAGKPITPAAGDGSDWSDLPANTERANVAAWGASQRKDSA